MTKKCFRLGMLATVLALGFVLAGCDGLLTGLNSTDENGNKPLDTTKTYAFYNYSTHTVTLQDSTGSHDLEPDDYGYGRFNYEISINDVTYSPSNYVKVEKYGSTSFKFTNRQ
jgi:hypothetical protein